MTDPRHLSPADRGQATITAIRAMRLDDGIALVRIDTDAGISGYGECGHNAGDLVRAVIAEYAEGGRLPHLGLLGRDPLAVRVLHHDMFAAYPQRRPHTQVLSGIDMALWDCCGKLLGQPVSVLLGGRFREEIELYSHCPNTGDFLDPVVWRDRAQALRADPRGFRAFKVDFHQVLGLPMQQVTASLSPGDIRKLRRAYGLAREHLGEDVDIIVHCHCELDTPSAIALAEAVEQIAPLCYEDPLQPAFGENWLALRRSTRLPIMTGENFELAEQALPFLTSQAVDVLQPDIVRGGGITGIKAMADLAALYRVPIALHNVSGLLLNLASAQLAASIFDCPRIEMASGATEFAWGAGGNPLQVVNGRLKIPNAPGLGFVPDADYLEAHRFAGEPWWDGATA